MQRSWGDSSDEEDEENLDYQQAYPSGSIVDSAIRNKNVTLLDRRQDDATLAPNKLYEDYNDNQEYSISGILGNGDDENEDDGEEEEEDKKELERRIEAAKQEAERKRLERESRKKPSSIKEQLNDLDDILCEFGIDAVTTNGTQNESSSDILTGDAALDEDIASSNNKRRKTKKKKKAANILTKCGPSDSTGCVESIRNDVNNINIEEESVYNSDQNDMTTYDAAPSDPQTIVVDPDAATKMLKAKSLAAAAKRKQPKSTAQLAAVTAAQEIKAAATDKKKKKKKDKLSMQYGR